jgi:hypothetical protein
MLSALTSLFRRTAGRGPAVFIAYRKADAAGWTSLLYARLARAFGADQIFLDDETLHAGQWRGQIDVALKSCRVMLVIVGPQWASVEDGQGRRRIMLQDDVHRREVATGLASPSITVIPVLTGSAALPGKDLLPDDLQTFPEQQAREFGPTQEEQEVHFTTIAAEIERITGMKARHEVEVSWLRRAGVFAIAVAVIAALLLVAFGSAYPEVQTSPALVLGAILCAALLWLAISRTARMLLSRSQAARETPPTTP